MQGIADIVMIDTPNVAHRATTTLVFLNGGDMLAGNTGLAKLLAAKRRIPGDRIGVKGSVATAVRINL